MKSLLILVGTDPSTTAVLSHIFANRHRVEVFDSADAALRYLDAEPLSDGPSVVLCDQTSADDATPTHVFRGLKNSHQTESLPTVLLAVDQKSTPTACATCELGWSDTIQKPFNPEDLTVRVRRLIAGHH